MSADSRGFRRQCRPCRAAEGRDYHGRDEIKKKARRRHEAAQARPKISAERLRHLLAYDAESGCFTWLNPTGKRAIIGAIAGHIHDKHGYVVIRLDGRTYYAHRLAWLYVHGEWPADEIDHKDWNRSNNRIANLREATHAENSQNMTKRRTNSSGSTGVSWLKALGKWEAYICADSKKVGLGYFDSMDEAAMAYANAKAKYHQFHPVEHEFG